MVSASILVLYNVRSSALKLSFHFPRKPTLLDNNDLRIIACKLPTLKDTHIQ